MAPCTRVRDPVLSPKKSGGIMGLGIAVSCMCACYSYYILEVEEINILISMVHVITYSNYWVDSVYFKE